MAVKSVFIDEEEWVRLSKVRSLDIAYRQLLHVNSMYIRKSDRAGKVEPLQAEITELRHQMGLA